MDLPKQITIGEDSVTEFKEVVLKGQHVIAPDTKDMADELAAAANTFGATFILGVNDKTRQVTGISPNHIDLVENWARNICNDSVKPPLVADIRKQIMSSGKGDEKLVLCMNVPKSLFVHKSPHGYFYRIGSSTREMTPEMLARLFQQRSQTRLICFDEQVVSNASLNELEPELFKSFRTSISSPDDQDFLRKLHFIATDTAGEMRPTVAGILFSNSHPETYLPSAYIQAVCYRGVERNANEQLDARDITGPLNEQIAEACRFVIRNMRIAAIKAPSRIDIPQYAINAIFEAIVNAVAHRDYSISGAKIRLHMFSDRLEIFSPGSLPNTMTLDEIGERQFSRNELICTCLARCRLPAWITDVRRNNMMDRRGEGVPVILSATKALADASPEYKLLNDAELLLTIPSAPIDDNDKLHKILSGKLVSEDKKLVSEDKKLVSEDKKLVSDDKKLVSEDKKLVSDDEKRVSDDHDESLVEHAKLSRPLSRPTLRQIAMLKQRFGNATFTLAEIAAGMPRSSAIRLMSKMKSAGIIVPVSSRGNYRFA